ncbi:MAG TPA: hypothetical protein GXX49_01895 [Clostridiaceae bacterium]|nr:hypothetical protein [Clostridiaceae bacterium]
MDKVVEYLIEQLMNNNCTVVLGAGISFESVYTLKKDEKPQKTENMVNTLRDYLCSNKSTDKCERCSIVEMAGCCIYKEVVNQNLAKLCQRYFWKIQNGRKRKCDTVLKKLVVLLKIDTFDCLEPSDAHYYIALIAREGLLSDVITTNYDCCLERAYFRTWGIDECKGNGECGIEYCKNNDEKDYEKSQVARITNQKSFMLQASRRNWFNENKTDHRLKPRVLRIYKINGCVCELRKENNSENYRTILLTETQLQDWRERHWAADFFKNRLRTTSLVFSGFGSNEPQILHTVQKVFEEFSEEFSLHVQSNGFDIWKLSNVPIIHSFEENTQYVHEYIARQYLSTIFNTTNDFDKLIIKKEKISGERGKLSANEFWRKIYLYVFKQKAIQILKRGYIFNNSLFQWIPCLDDVLNEVRENIKKSYKEMSIESLNENERSIIDAFDINKYTIWEKHLKYFYKLLPQIAIWLIKLCHRSSDCEAFSYYPITECSELFIELVFFLQCLPGAFEISPYSNGIMVKCKSNHEGATGNFQMRILLSTADTGLSMQADNEAFLDYDGTMITELRFGIYHEESLNRSYRILGSNGPIHVKVIHWKDIFKGFEDTSTVDQNKIDKVKETVRDALLFPSKYQRYSRKSIPERLREFKQRG